MIVDKIENATLYMCLSDRFMQAFEILKDHKSAGRADGRYDIDGDNLYYMVQRYTTKPADQCKLEAHKRYIDVQFIADGEELFGFSLLDGLEIEKPYDREKDFAFYKVPAGINTMRLRRGMFCIFFPQDAHMPCCQVDGPSSVHKVVVKVRMNTQ